MNQPSPVTTLRLDQLAPSPFNPRVTFAPGPLTELAADIHRHGVLLPILVSEDLVDRANGVYPVVAGERRRRAIELLNKAGRWPDDRPIPCSLVAGDDATLLTISLVENLQREDLDPVEEAHGFQALCDMKDGDWTTESIAAAISKTQRHVQLRLELLTKLTPQTRLALQGGAISLAQARELTAADKSKQANIVAEIKHGYRPDAAAVRSAVAGARIPVGRAIFDTAKVKVPTWTDPDDGQTYFTDRKKFREAQHTAAEAEVETLSKTWAWAELVDYHQPWNYTKSANKKKAGGVIELDGGGAVTIHTGLVKRPPAKSKPKDKPDDPADAFTQAHLFKARRLKTLALQSAVADDPTTALRLVILALMGETQGVRIRVVERGSENEVLAPAVKDKSDAQAKRFGKLLANSFACDPSLMGLGHMHMHAEDDPNRDVKAYAVLKKTGPDDLMDILAVLVAARFGSFNDYTAALGDRPLACRIAKSLGVGVGDGFTIDEDFLATCRKPGLIEIVDVLAREAGAATLDALKNKADATRVNPETLTLKSLRALILAGVADGHLKHHVPRELVFGSAAELHARKGPPAEAPPTAKAKPKAKPKAKGKPKPKGKGK